jgi:iron complex outermembrane receptor protein
VTPRQCGGFYRPSAICDQAALAFHPRIPRYGEVRHDRERLGITGSVQWAPTEATKVSIDGLYSRFKETREEKWGEVLLRSNERSIDLTNFTVDSSTRWSGHAERCLGPHRALPAQVGHRILPSRRQLGPGDRRHFRFTLLGGVSKSDADIPVETTFVFDDRDAQGYSSTTPTCAIPS